MCNEVLNDKWASHPTWASEDSGFVAHKKNQYEDVLHRIEEERHDYDFNVESNLRTIQLLEPIAQRIACMSSEEKENFRLQPGLEGQSKTIYQRIIKKVWGKDAGLEIIEALHNNPVKAVPLVLGRLKKKDEEWKAAQREWQKVWRDQTVRVFWKSLDHQGITIKSNDKKQFQLKALVAEIMAKRDEQLNRKTSAIAPPPEYQFVYTFPDTGIILDVSRLLAIALENGSGFSISDREKIHGFIKSFIPLFFGISQRDVEDTVNSVSHKSDDEDSEDVTGGSESPTRRPRARQDTDLLRDVLKRRSKGSRKDQEGSVASRDSSIDPHDGDVEMMNAPAERPAKEEGNWISKPTRYLTGLKPGNVPMSPVENEERNKITKRTAYSMFCNGTIYGFFRAFQILYDRLSAVKASELSIRADVEAHKMQKVARELNILPTRIEDIFPDTGPNANYYSQTLEWCEKLLEGEIEASNFEESLRTGLVQTGWKLYTIEKTCNAILKFIQNIVPSDSREKNLEKEKTADIVLRYQKDRERKEISRDRGEYQELIAYRRTVESILGSQDDLYRIDWVRIHLYIYIAILLIVVMQHEDTKTATIGVVGRDSPTITVELDRDERWNYYTQAYMMVAPTEGVPLERCRPVFLRRSFPREAELSNADRAPEAIFVKENMEVRICVNTYRLFFMQGTEDLILKDRGRWAEVSNGAPKKRAEKWRGVLDGLVKRGAPDGERARNQEGWDAFVRGRVPSEPRKRKAEETLGVGGPVSPKRQRSVPAEDVDMGGV
jgi:paired amphipathic helix protein Sin3a